VPNSTVASYCDHSRSANTPWLTGSAVSSLEQGVHSASSWTTRSSTRRVGWKPGVAVGAEPCQVCTECYI